MAKKNWIIADNTYAFNLKKVTQMHVVTDDELKTTLTIHLTYGVIVENIKSIRHATKKEVIESSL